MFGLSTLRIASRTFARQQLNKPVAALPRFTRQFSVSRVRRNELPPEYFKQIEHTELYQKLQHRPEALTALVRLANIVADAGIDLSSGRKPSPLQLYRLATNRKFTREIENMMEELEKAGLDVSSQEALQDMMKMVLTNKSEPKNE